MLYVWNGMAMLAGATECRKKHLELISSARDALEKKKEDYEKESGNGIERYVNFMQS